MKYAVITTMMLSVCVGLASAGTRADLSGDAVIDFATTMDMPFMTVGNAGNAGEQSRLSVGDETWYGGVDHLYNVGKFEVTAGQYTEFLNAVAADDTYGLYNTNMWSNAYGCKIDRSGSSGSYTYSVAADWEDRPVNYVSWGDSARFSNWLTNRMPTGAQDLTTTEDGSYFLNGATSDAALLAVTRDADARYVVPSENELYKAAYHANDGISANYWEYPTGTDTTPSNDLLVTDPGNNGNFWIQPDDWTVSGPYYRTEVGDFENSDSPYGAFDMGGNVWEWNETVISGLHRGVHGGSFDYHIAGGAMRASSRGDNSPTYEYFNVGFRVAEVPEPATLSLLSLGGLAILRRRKE